MRVLRGKKTVDMSRDELMAAANTYSKVLLDIGAGDGKFVYRFAIEHQDTFCIGLDAVAENLREMSAKANRKPARGGLRNVLFVVASVESLPSELEGIADTITVNYPWGSLLSALVRPDDSVLQSIARLGKPGAKVIVLLNYSVFEDPQYVDRLGLPRLDQHYVETVLMTAYGEAGLDVQQCGLLGDEVPHRTSWGQSLIQGGGRETLLIECLARPH